MATIDTTLEIRAKRIVLVEDDYDQVPEIAGVLEERFPNVATTVFGTEKDFRKWMDGTLRDTERRPDLFVIDGLLTWDDPSAHSGHVADRDPSGGGFVLGGLRCLRRLNEDPEFRDVPAILYSVFGPGDMARRAQHYPHYNSYRDLFTPPNYRMGNRVYVPKEMRFDNLIGQAWRLMLERPAKT